MFPALTPDQKEWFTNLWENGADEYAFFELAQDYNPGLTFAKFDHGWQFTTVLDESLSTAINEFILAAHDAV